MKKILFLLFLSAYAYSQTPFRTDSALSYLKIISVDIGPRPMGSINEQRGMDFALSKFREFGLDESYIMRMNTASNDISGVPINTNSGVAVGILHGKTGRIIIIGAHIDSADPQVPGANDDGSGAAALIELARVLSRERHESTIIFTLFGGEEYGLCGSRFFVRNFPLIDSVALMLQMDMANGREILVPTVKSEKGSSPEWLVKAAYEELSNLGYSGFTYPVHFFTEMEMLPGGGVTSDQDPFLRIGIPAIDFTSDFDDPIHTPQDDFEHFKPEGLKRSGDLVYALVRRYDGGVPEEKTGNYFLVQIFNRPLFVPIWSLYIFTILSIIFSAAVLIIVRKRRTETVRSARPKIPALKLFIPAVLIQILVWSSEYIVGLIKGVRFPWMAYPEWYFVLGSIAGLLGISLSLNLTKRMNLSRDPYRWFLRTVATLFVFIILLSFTGVKSTVYPAFALLFLSLSMYVRRPLLKFIFWLISPHLMFRLIFSEGFVFIGRGMALQATQDLSIYFTLNIFYVLFFALWSFPFLLGFAAFYSDIDTDLLGLKWWRGRAGLAALIILFILCISILSVLPSYSDEWRSQIRVEQTVNCTTGEGKIALNSSEYLKDLRIRIRDRDTVISTWDRSLILERIQEPSWIKVGRKTVIAADSNTTFDISLDLDFKFIPEELTILYSAGRNKMRGAIGSYITGTTDHSIVMRWKAMKGTELTVPVCFTIVGSDSVTEIIEAKFAEQVEPLHIERKYTNMIPVTTFRRTCVLDRGSGDQVR